jgi:histidine ammonia-lyase
MVEIGGKYFDVNDFRNIVFNREKSSLFTNSLIDVKNNFEFLKDFSCKRTIYGINTGFGPMARYKIEDEDIKQLQYNLIRSHCAGSGEILPEIYARGVVAARLNTLMLASSGIHPEVVELLNSFLNNNISPVIPEHGGVGASGDLVQLAHLALNVIGEGEVYFNGEIVPVETAFKKCGLKPAGIHLREGLALINGTSVMTAIGIINLLMSQRALDWAVAASALLMEVVECYDDHYSIETNGVKLHKGQSVVAQQLSSILSGSELVKNRSHQMYDKEVPAGYIEEKVQEFYSIRCVPQVLGPVSDTLEFSKNILFDEINSVNDNPVVSHKKEFVYHGGNFHGDYISFEMDKMKTAVTKMTMLCERQINYLMNPKLNEKLPPFVNLGTIGLNYGMQAVQFTAVSTTAENQSLCFPNYIHSISNNNDNQDIVSMGTNSANIARKVIDNSFEVIAIELMALTQAIEYLKCKDKMSLKTKSLFEKLREIVPPFIEDTTKNKEIENMKKFIYHNDVKSFY